MKLRQGFKIAASLAAVCFSVGSASAATVSAEQDISPGFGSTTWYLSNTYASASPFTGECSSGVAGFNLDDADGPTSDNDAYDVAWEIFVNGTGFVAPGGNVDLTGTTVTAGPSTIAGLQVTVQHYFATGSAVDRILVSLRNPGLVSIPATVQVPVNFGSDSGTILRTTSSGDAVVTTSDRWMITSDSVPSDPVNTTVFYGPGSPAVTPTSYTQTVFDCSATNGLGATFNLTIPAGGTRSLMFFAGLGGVTVNDNVVASAQSAAALFNSNATLLPGWLTGLTTAQKAQIANWSFPSTCSGAGYVGSQLTVCKLACESNSTPSVKAALIQAFYAAYHSYPTCSL